MNPIVARLTEYVTEYLNGIWKEEDLILAFRINTGRDKGAEDAMRRAVSAALVSNAMCRRVLAAEVIG